MTISANVEWIVVDMCQSVSGSLFWHLYGNVRCDGQREAFDLPTKHCLDCYHLSWPSQTCPISHPIQTSSPKHQSVLNCLAISKQHSHFMLCNTHTNPVSPLDSPDKSSQSTEQSTSQFILIQSWGPSKRVWEQNYLLGQIFAKRVK